MNCQLMKNNYIKYLDGEMLIKETDQESLESSDQHSLILQKNESCTSGSYELERNNDKEEEMSVDQPEFNKCLKLKENKVKRKGEIFNIYVDSLVTLCLTIDRFELFYVSDEEIKILDSEKDRVICINKGSFIDNTLMLENMDKTDEIMERYESDYASETNSPINVKLNFMPNSQPMNRKAIDFMCLGEKKVTLTSQDNQLMIKKNSYQRSDENLSETNEDDDDEPESLMFPPNQQEKNKIKEQSQYDINIEDIDKKEQENAWNFYQNEKLKNQNKQVILDDQGRRKSQSVTYSNIKKKKPQKFPHAAQQDPGMQPVGFVSTVNHNGNSIHNVGMHVASAQNMDNLKPSYQNMDYVKPNPNLQKSKFVRTAQKLPHKSHNEYNFLQYSNSNNSPDEYENQLEDVLKASMQTYSHHASPNNFEFLDMVTSDDQKFMNNFDSGFLLSSGQRQIAVQQQQTSFHRKSIDEQNSHESVNDDGSEESNEMVKNVEELKSDSKVQNHPHPLQNDNLEHHDSQLNVRSPQLAVQEEVKVKQDLDEVEAPIGNFDGYDDDLMLGSDFGDEAVNELIPKPKDALKPSNDTYTNSKKSFNQEDSNPIDPLKSIEPDANLIPQVTIKKVSSVRPDYSSIKIDEQLMLQNVMQNKGYSNVLSSLVNKVKKLELKLIEANSKIHEKEKDIKLMKKVSKMKINGHDQREIHFAFLFASPLVRYIDDRKEQVMLLDCLKELEDICGVVSSVDYQLKFRSSVATKDNFRSVVTDRPYVLHFSGHGLPNDPKVLGSDYFDNQGKGGVLLLEDNKCRSYNYYQEELRSLLEA